MGPMPYIDFIPIEDRLETFVEPQGPLSPEPYLDFCREPSAQLLEMAQDPYTPPEVLVGMADNPGEHVRVKIMAVRNPSFPRADLLRIARTPVGLECNPSVRRTAVELLAAEDPATWGPLLEAMTTSDAAVEERILRGDDEATAVAVLEGSAFVELRLVAIASLHRSAEVRLRAAMWTDLSHDVLERLAADPDPRVAVAALWNEDADGEILRIAARHSDPRVRVQAALSHEVPGDVLRRLAKDPVIEVVRAAVTNGFADAGLLWDAATEIYDNETSRRIACHPNASLDTLKAIRGNSANVGWAAHRAACRSIERLAGGGEGPAA